MKSNSVSLNANSLVLGALGLLGALLVIAVLTDRPIPLISSHRGAFFVLLTVGFVMCSVGPLRNIQPNQWLQPMNVAAALLGSLALLLGMAVLAGWKIPLLPGNRESILLLAGIVLSKVILATVHHAWLDKLVR